MLGRLVAVFALGGFLPLGASIWWPLELLSHFRIQYIVLAVLFAITAFACRHRTGASMLVLAAGVNVWPLLPYLPKATAGDSTFEFAVLNVNVNSTNGKHAEIIAAIAAARPDLVSIIELSTAFDAALEAAAGDLSHRYTLPARGNFGIGIVSRYPISRAASLSLGETFAIDSTVELPSGQLRFLAVHLVPPMGETLARERNRQLERLADYAEAAPEPLLVCGDFNLTPYSPMFRRFADEANLRDTRLGRGLGISWPTFMPLLGIPIDHCLIRGPIEAKSVSHLERIGSDHYPVQVELRWLNEQ